MAKLPLLLLTSIPILACCEGQKPSPPLPPPPQGYMLASEASALGELTRPGPISRRSRPGYPWGCLPSEQEGRVHYFIYVDEQGTVQYVEIHPKSDRKCWSAFADAARSTILQQRWEPATVDGDPIKFKVCVTDIEGRPE